MPDAFDLLRHAVFEHEDIVSFKAGIEVTVLIDGEYGQLHFLGEDTDRLLLFIVYWRRLRGRRWL